MAKHMLKLGGNKKLLQAEISLLDKRVTLKDLHNLNTEQEEDSLKSRLSYLLKKESSTVEILKNDDNVFLGLFYQDQNMKDTFTSYPEVLFVDAIYKVSNLRIPLYIFAVEDSNGETEIVAFFLAAVEDGPTIDGMVNTFKKFNPEWEKTQSVMADKDFEERAAFHRQVCIFACSILCAASEGRSTARKWI